MSRILELRQKKGGSFNDSNSLVYVKTNIKAVDGLMIGEKIKLSLLPSEILKSKKQVAIINENTNTEELLNQALVFVGGNTEALTGCFFIINTATQVTVTVSPNHEFLNGDNETGTISSGQTVILEDGDQISMNNYGTGWEIIETIQGYGATNPSLPNGTYPKGARFFNTTQGVITVNVGGNWIDALHPFVDDFGTTFPASPAENQTYFLTTELTKYRFKSISGWSIIDNNMPYAVGASTVGASTGGKISPTDISKLYNLSNYTHPTGGANVTLDGGDIQFVADLTVNNLGHVTAASLGTIRTASTSATGVVELATNTEAQAGTDTTRALTVSAGKALVDRFGSLKQYNVITDSVTTANGNHPDEAFALFETGITPSA